MVDEDEPERQPATDIEPQITAIVETNGRTLPRSLQTAVDGFDGSDLRALNILVADSAALVLWGLYRIDASNPSSPANLGARSPRRWVIHVVLSPSPLHGALLAETPIAGTWAKLQVSSIWTRQVP
jgi:hypothetical protein